MQTLRDLWQRGAAALGSCALCAAWPAPPICTDCLATFGTAVPRCPRCALPLAPGLAFCTDCATLSSPVLNQCAARVDYAYPWNGLIGQLKFHQRPGWAHVLGPMLVNDPSILEMVSNCDVWTPVPLTPSRLAARGYNQSWELLKAAHQHLHGQTPLWPQLLTRSDTRTIQHHLPRANRLTNPHLRFGVPSHLVRHIHKRHVLVVDDVMTTGATLNAAAQALLAAGASRVSGLVFARTPATPRHL
jgi:predicted amidophosphoribosyltransferase